MFYQTYTARKPLSACTAVTLSPRPRLRRNGVVCCCLQRTAHALLCIVNGDDSAVFFVFFVPDDLDLRPLTVTFKLFRARVGTKHVFPVN